MRVGVIASDGTFSVYEAGAVEYVEGTLYVTFNGKNLVVAEPDDETAKKIFEALMTTGQVAIRLDGEKVGG